ncbi:hypothetical protein [Methanospirillum sp.]|uniref:hypothetical protein n=1 Tax=Methanospirillum sp. TaxID=45200 RepID=UPI001BD3F121|nr:hypothetical protein [Methanospirillum sp.]
MTVTCLSCAQNEHNKKPSHVDGLSFVRNLTNKEESQHVTDFSCGKLSTTKTCNDKPKTRIQVIREECLKSPDGRPNRRFIAYDDRGKNKHHPGYASYYPQCKQCGDYFSASSPFALYCSQRCRNDAFIERRREKHSRSLKKVCLYCRSEFKADRIDKKYCSNGCRQKAYRNRKAKNDEEIKAKKQFDDKMIDEYNNGLQ